MCAGSCEPNDRKSKKKTQRNKIKPTKRFRLLFHFHMCLNKLFNRMNIHYNVCEGTLLAKDERAIVKCIHPNMSVPNIFVLFMFLLFLLLLPPLHLPFRLSLTFQNIQPIEISHKMLSNHQIARYLCGINVELIISKINTIYRTYIYIHTLYTHISRHVSINTIY